MAARQQAHFQQFYRSLNRNRSHDRREARFTELPTIDIRDLAGDDLARRQAVADAIGRAARRWAFSTSPATVSTRR